MGKKKDNRRLRNRHFIWRYLLQHPCISCGESNIILLEFDHRIPADKLFNISDAPNMKISLERIQKEIDKCDVLCANCHRLKTASQFKHYEGLEDIINERKKDDSPKVC